MRSALLVVLASCMVNNPPPGPRPQPYGGDPAMAGGAAPAGATSGGAAPAGATSGGAAPAGATSGGAAPAGGAPSSIPPGGGTMAGDTPGTVRGAAPGTMGGPAGNPSATGGGCFGGYWRGIVGAAGARRNIKLYLQQSGTQLSGKLEFHGYDGLEATQQITGAADCGASTATLNVASSTEKATDITASTYSLKLVRTPGYPLRFEGSFPCKDSHCPGEIKGELQQ